MATPSLFATNSAVPHRIAYCWLGGNMAKIPETKAAAISMTI